MTKLSSGLMGGLLLAASAHANTDYTYVFTANPGQVTWYNGTTIEISVTPNPYIPNDPLCTVVSLNMIAEIDMAAQPAEFGYGPAPASLTPGSMTLPYLAGGYPGQLESHGVGNADSSGWTTEFDTGWSGGTPFGCPALYAVLTSSSVQLSINSGGLDPAAFMDTPATGTWSFMPLLTVQLQPFVVPDETDSFTLLAAAAAILGARLARKESP